MVAAGIRHNHAFGRRKVVLKATQTLWLVGLKARSAAFMRIMFLDDMKSRRDAFQKNAIGHTVDFAITAQQAIDLLKANEYDMIYLDHDLEEAHYNRNNDDDEDGRFVARALKEMAQHYGKIVIVHSLNPSGRANIKSILGDDFDIWMTENLKHSALWQIEVNILHGAIEKYHAQSKE